jgi:hypothetical protein
MSGSDTWQAFARTSRCMSGTPNTLHRSLGNAVVRARPAQRGHGGCCASALIAVGRHGLGGGGHGCLHRADRTGSICIAAPPAGPPCRWHRHAQAAAATIDAQRGLWPAVHNVFRCITHFFMAPRSQKITLITGGPTARRRSWFHALGSCRPTPRHNEVRIAWAGVRREFTQRVASRPGRDRLVVGAACGARRTDVLTLDPAGSPWPRRPA